MTLLDLYMWFCFGVVSLVSLWGVLLVLSYVAIYLLEQTLRHLEVYKAFVAWYFDKKENEE
jgi:hypothetical protein